MTVPFAARVISVADPFIKQVARIFSICDGLFWSVWTRLVEYHLIGIVPGGEERPEGICEEANQTEPSRQHQQQGEEEDEELHDDETESERQNKRQTLLQRQTGERNLSRTRGRSLFVISCYIWLSFALYSDCPAECTPEKEEAAQIKHTDVSLFICPTVMYISETRQYISTS